MFAYVCRSQIRGFGMLVQKRAAERGMASPTKYAEELERKRVAEGKHVPEFVKAVLRDWVQEKGTSNPAKGKRKPKAGASANDA